MGKCLIRMIGLLIAISCLISCKKESVQPELTVSETSITLMAEKDTVELTIGSNDKWTIANSASWLNLSQTNGNSGAPVTIQIIAEANATGSTRTTILVVNSPNGQSRRVTVSQPSTYYPSYNTSPIPPDATGMSSTAVELAAKMHMGINFGNTMESPKEAEWVSSKITESYVKFVKGLGFNAVRLPTGWVWSHLSDPAKMKIDPVWLNRVKEVVGWCVANDMYVILNAHGDNGWLERNVSNAKKDSINAKLRAIWEQIATTMRDFDEHVIFAGTNEPSVDNAEQTFLKLLVQAEHFLSCTR